LTRSRNIPALLALIEARSAIPFSWSGEADCASFAALAAKAQSGIDARGQLRWNGVAEAFEIIRAEGGLAMAFDRRFRRVAEAMAQRGDIAAVADRRFGIGMMVVEGRTLVGPGKNGLERQSRSAMIMSWDAMSGAAIDGDAG
jgi:hypothetical protein